MRLATLVVMTAMGGSGWADETSAAHLRNVTVCVNAGYELQTASAAKKLAAKMFAGIGVGIEWRTYSVCSPADAIRVDFSNHTPASEHPHALAYACPFGTTIVVYQDRLERLSKAIRPEQLLSWVLVHEISHILQSVDRHSATGIMKAHWTSGDYFDLQSKGPGFTAEEVDLIHTGLANRALRVAGTDLQLVVAVR